MGRTRTKDLIGEVLSRLRALLRGRVLRLLALVIMVYALVVFVIVPRPKRQHLQHRGSVLESDLPTRVQACSTSLPGQRSTHGQARMQLYDRLGAEVVRKGVPALDGSTSSSSTQGLQLSDLFSFDEGKIIPHLTRLETAVRAIVVPFQEADVKIIHQSVVSALEQVLGTGAVWYQDPKMYHANVWHASHHKDPQPASAEEVDDEAASVAAVARAACEMEVVLERIVFTPGGVLIACWQVASGTDPAQLRRTLRARLPRSPQVQMLSEEVILHSTLARILKLLPGKDPAASVATLTHTAEELSHTLCGLRLTLSQLWFVEEFDLLALALGGGFSKRILPLECAVPPEI